MKQDAVRDNNTRGRPMRLGKTSIIVLVVVIFLILFGGLYYINQQQPARQAQLNKDLSSMQKLVSASTTRKGAVEAEITQAEKELKLAKEAFAQVDSAPEILDDLVALAKASNIEITSTKVTQTKQSFTQSKVKTEFPVLNLQLGFRGQVPKFQNFLLSLYSKFPMVKVKEVTMEVAQKETEQDKATILIDIYCLDEGK